MSDTRDNVTRTNKNPPRPPSTGNPDLQEAKRLHNIYVKRVKLIDPELGKIDLEVILINSLVINAGKVQEITDTFIMDKTYISIFCFTETKVDCIDFRTKRIKLYTKHRTNIEKKGGGLAIGHLIDNRIKLEEIQVENNNILIIEETIYKEKIRILLTYRIVVKTQEALDTILI